MYDVIPLLWNKFFSSFFFSSFFDFHEYSSFPSCISVNVKKKNLASFRKPCCYVVAMDVCSAEIASEVICAVVIWGDANNMDPVEVESNPVPSAAPCRPCPAICELYSAVSILRMYGIMLSIWTLPISPAKKSSSITLGLREWRAGRRSNSFARRSGLEGWVCRTWLANSRWALSWTLSICGALGKEGVSVKYNSM